MMTITLRRAAACALFFTLAACGAPTQSGFNATPGVVHQTAKAHSQRLIYASSNSSGTGAVYVYSAKGQGQQPIGTITDGISTPAGLAVDSSGDLYVANTGNNTVTVYPPGQTTPSVTYSNGITAPEDVAVGKDGTVYVANQTGSVTEYPSGSTSPNLTITLANEYAYGVGLDASNSLYVSWFSLSSYAMEIYKYPTEGSGSGTNLNLDLPSTIFPAFSIAFDNDGNMVIPVESLAHYPPGYLAVFPPGATEPKRKIKEGGLLDVVVAIAFPSGKSKLFYVAAASDNDWLALTYPKLIPRDVVNIDGLGGLAISF